MPHAIICTTNEPNSTARWEPAPTIPAPFTVRLDEPTLSALDGLAIKTDRSRNWLVSRAMEEFIALNAWQIEKVEAGIAAADRGDFAGDDEPTRVRKEIRAQAMRVRWTAPALGDLEAIGDSIGRENSPAVAARIVSPSLDQADKLAAFPHVGRVGRVPDTRELVVVNTPFIAPYRVRDDEVEILAVFHGSRRWPEKFE